MPCRFGAASAFSAFGAASTALLYGSFFAGSFFAEVVFSSAAIIVPWLYRNITR
jgi:hypothetical protein